MSKLLVFLLQAGFVAGACLFILAILYIVVKVVR